MRFSIVLLLGVWTYSGYGARVELDKYLVAQGPDTKTYVFDEPRRVAAILQRNGTHNFVLENGPSDSRWEWSRDGMRWRVLSGTERKNDSRLFRLHVLGKAVTAKYFRLRFDHGSCAGEAVFDEKLKSPEEWVLVINSTDDRRLPGHGQEFIPLVRSVQGWEGTRAQQVWVGDLTPELVEAEPKPVALFFSGSFKDWCNVDRNDWKGVEKVLSKKTVPIWASCGGAQALAILSETGTRKPWDCPHCRNPRAAKIPIYTHIGHAVSGKPCGDYSGCIFEKGPTRVRVVGNNSVFEGLPDEFKVMESHCGQIAWAPRGWKLIATAGEGSLTRVQCIKREGVPIYAAQFHIEMSGTPESSVQIMKNFLEEAQHWRR